MKKKGFTLSELIITLAIIAIAAALTLPALMNMIPDKHKVRIINTYNDLYAATQNILSADREYFKEKDVAGAGVDNDGDGVEDMPCVDSDNSYCPDGIADCIGLACTEKVSVAGVDYQGATKYIGLLNKELGGTLTGGKIVLKDGVTISVDQKVDSSGAIQFYVIVVDTKLGGSCVYGNDDCSNPDTFKIKVENDGSFTAADPLLEAYLLNPTNMNDKDKDFDLAETFKSKDYGITISEE